MTDFYNLEIHESEIVFIFNNIEDIQYKSSLFLNRNYNNILEIKTYLKSLFKDKFSKLQNELKKKDFDEFLLYDFEKTISKILLKKINRETLEETNVFLWEFELSTVNPFYQDDFPFKYKKTSLSGNLKDLSGKIKHLNVN